MDIYQDIILDHFQNPRNFGVLEDVDTLTLDNPSCGDSISLSVKIENDRIANIAFQGKGCAISQASTSLLTEHVKGKTVSEVDKMNENAILDLLGIPLSPGRMKCAMLGLQTLQRLLSKE